MRALQTNCGYDSLSLKLFEEKIIVLSKAEVLNNAKFILHFSTRIGYFTGR